MAVTVTAQAAGSTFNGILLRVAVLTGAALSTNPASASQAGAAAHQAAVTTTAAGSLVYAAMVNAAAQTSFTAAASTTLTDNFADSVNGAQYGTGRTTSVTGTPGAVTVGASAPAGAGSAALLEILPAGTITLDASSPAVASATGAFMASTAPFNPPPGSLLVAMVASNGAAGTTTMTVSGGGLAWTEQVKGNGASDGYAGVWTAQVPAAFPDLTTAPAYRMSPAALADVLLAFVPWPPPGPAALPAAAAAAPPRVQVPQPRRVSPARARTGRGLVAAGLIGAAGVTTGQLPPAGPRIGHPAPHRVLWRGAAGSAPNAAQQSHAPPRFAQRIPHRAVAAGTRGAPPAAQPQPLRPVTAWRRTPQRVLWRGGTVPAVTAVQGTGLPPAGRPVTVFRRAAHRAAWRSVTGAPPPVAQAGGAAQPFTPKTVFRRAAQRASWEAVRGQPPAAARQPRIPATVFTRAAHRALWHAGAGSPPGPPPAFTVGALTAVTVPYATLTASGAPSGVMTAGTASATLTAAVSAGPGVTTVPGAYLSNMYQSGAADFTAQSALWTALSGTPVKVARYYKALSDFTLTADMSEMIAAGVKICLTLRPAYNPVSAGDLAAMTTLLQAMAAAGAKADIALWHEPFFGGLTAGQFTAMIAYYGPSVRAYYPLVFCGSGPDLVLANGYYPGDSAVDKIACDQYAFGTVSPDPGSSLDNAQGIADAAVPPKPLGLWEFGGSTDAVNGQSQAFVTTWLGNVQAFFLARLAAGKANADILLFNSGTGNFLGNATNQLCGFEGGIGTWFPRSNCTVAGSAAQAYEGSGSLAMTATGVSNMTAAPWTAAQYLSALPVAPAQSVTVSAQYRAATAARLCATGVSWYNAAGGFLSTSFGAATAGETTSGWFALTQSFTAPGSAAWAEPFTEVNAPAGAGEVHYVDNVACYVNQAGLVTTIWSAKDYRVPLYAGLFAALNAAPVPAALRTSDARLGVLTGATAP